MGKRKDRKEYQDEEASFLIRTIDLQEVIEDHGYVYSRRDSTQSQPVFIRGDRKLTVRIGQRSGDYIWVDLKNIETSHGKIVQFMMMEYGCDMKGAFDKMREIAEGKYGVEYQLFKDGFNRREQSPTSQKRKVIRPGSQFAVFDLDVYLRERKPVEQEFTYYPGQSVPYDFFLGRGITQETLDHPLFRERFGIAAGPFGNTEMKPGTLKPDDFEFSYHIIVPYWDVDGKIVALEAKNRLTGQAYEKEIDREIKEGGRASDVRRNPSKFYKGSSKQSAWLSHIPHQPVAIFVSEQPADALAYFQLHRDDPAIHKTIFMTTGGVVVDGHYAILHKLIREHDIQKVTLGFDRDLAGLKYTLLTMQNLPFTRKEEQKYGLTFGISERFEMELGLMLLGELQQYNTDQLLASLDKIRKHIEEHFQFEGKVEFFPALTLGNKLATISIPYTPRNADEILRLSHAFLKTQYGKFDVHVPKLAKDWNDQLLGIEAEPPTPSTLLYDHAGTRNRIFITADNTVIYQQRLVSFDHNLKEVVGQINPFAIRHFIKRSESLLKHKFLLDALDKLREDYVSVMPELKEAFLRDALKRNIHYTGLDGMFRKGETALARWDAGKDALELLTEAEEADQKVLQWMSGAIQAGRDPNAPDISLNYNKVMFREEVMGVISNSFIFQDAEDFAMGKLGESGRAQLDLFLDALLDVRMKWRIFREKYPEPIHYYTSANLVLKENQNPLYRYVPGQYQVESLSSVDTLNQRTLNPFFYQALQLFQENQGTFYNYTRLMRLDMLNDTIFYRSRGQEIGRLIRDGETTYFALYSEVPEAMRREMKLMAPYGEAPQEILEKFDVSLKPSRLQGQIKENKISNIPLPYLRFYDERGKRFVSMAEEKLKKLSSSTQQLYTDAYLWHLNHIGNPNPALGNEREKFFERDGTIYFNRIPVAVYNAETDVLESVAAPSGKFFQFLAVFERNLVRDPTHRKYADYLVESPELKLEATLPEAEIIAFLDKIEKGEDNRIRFVDNQFKLRELGYLVGKSLVVDEGYRQYSETFTEAMVYFAAKKHYVLEWKSFEEPVAVKQNLNSIELSAPLERFDLQFRLTPSGVIQSIVTAPVFLNKMGLDERGELVFSFLVNKDGQKTMKFSDNFETMKEPQFWMSRQLDQPTTMVLTQDPRQAIYYYQYNLPESMYGRELYMALMNYDLKLGKNIVDKMITSYGIKELHIVGEDSFVNAYQTAFSKKSALGILPVSLITAEQSVQKFTRYISGFEPKPELQAVLSGVSGHNFLNPADGMMLFPMKSPSSSSRAVLGEQMFFSKDADALWFSRPLKEASRIVLVANPEEALHYLALNKDYVREEALISFQNTVTDNQIQHLTELLRLPRFYERLAVANSFRLSEQLLDRQFRLPFVVEKPLHETSFQKEYEVIAAGIQGVKRDIRLPRRHFLEGMEKEGKFRSPVDYGQTQGRIEAGVRP